MENQLVLRYYQAPDLGSEYKSPALIGISTWLPQKDQTDNHTMTSEKDIVYEASVSDSYGYRLYVSALKFNPSEGNYEEKEVFLLDEDEKTVINVTEQSFPLKVYFFCEAQGYIGGVAELGFYNGSGEYESLARLWVNYDNFVSPDGYLSDSGKMELSVLGITRKGKIIWESYFDDEGVLVDSEHYPYGILGIAGGGGANEFWKPFGNAIVSNLDTGEVEPEEEKLPYEFATLQSATAKFTPELHQDKWNPDIVDVAFSYWDKVGSIDYGEGSDGILIKGTDAVLAVDYIASNAEFNSFTFSAEFLASMVDEYEPISAKLFIDNEEVEATRYRVNSWSISIESEGIELIPNKEYEIRLELEVAIEVG